MEALFNITCFVLSVGVIAAAACSVVRISSLREDLQENEAELLLERARSSQEAQASGYGRETAPSRHSDVQNHLSRAGISATPAQWRLLTVATATLLSIATFAVAQGASQQGSPAGLAVSLLVFFSVLTGFSGYVKRKTAKQTLLLEKQLAQVEMQIAENSRSGLPVSRSIASCSELADEPLRSHMRRLHNEMTYSNCTLADGFSNMAKRTQSGDVRLLAEVIAIQQRTGSNLADALDFLHETISRRLEMRQALRSTLAETKITKTIVAITPWAIFALLSFAPLIRIEGFWDFYSSNPIGWLVLGFCITTEAGILALISRMSNLEID